MRRALRLAALIQAYGLLVLHSLLVVCIVRVALSVTTYRKIAQWMPAIADRHVSETRVRHILRAVVSVAKYVPKASCLTQALSAQYLCGKAGYATSVMIGVAKNKVNDIEAHAWLARDGRVLIGGTLEEIGRYTPIADLTCKRA